MTTLNEILKTKTHAKYATDYGTKTHVQLQRVVIDSDTEQGAPELINKIKQVSGLSAFFSATAKTEVPVAGTINNSFISRRIDRLCIDDKNKHIDIIDYKTDINRETFRTKYIAQIREYIALLAAIYPDYSVDGYILWTHDFSLEKVATK